MMNKTAVALALAALVLTGCSSTADQAEEVTGAKPITIITPSQVPTDGTGSPLPVPSVKPAKEQHQLPDNEREVAQQLQPPTDSLPRETDFNNADISFAAESAIRNQRMIQAAEVYLQRQEGTSESVRTMASEIQSQQSEQLVENQELLAKWGVSNPEFIFPANPAGIPTQADVDQLGSFNGADLDQRYLTLVQRNFEGAAESAANQLNAGFNPEVNSNAQQLIDELPDLKVSFSKLQG